jgi:soluble lytic murein transglycosylase
MDLNDIGTSDRYRTGHALFVQPLPPHRNRAGMPPGSSNPTPLVIIQTQTHQVVGTRRTRARSLRLAAGLLLLAVMAVQAKSDPLEAQRELFLDARAALQENRMAEYRSLARQLRDYPLYPYLQFDELRNRLSLADEQEVARFLEIHDGEPVGDRMRQSWLYNLARNQRWRLFLRYYRPTDTVDLQCYALQARLNTGDKKALVEDILALWLAGESRPKACDPPFRFLADGGHLNRDRVWARIRLAMQGNRPALAGYLGKRLPEAEQAWVTLWREANEKPSSTLEDPRLEADMPLAREIILHALRRIARFDAAQAHAKWLAIRDTQAFEAGDAAAIQGYIAYAAATQRLPQAHAWLVALPAAAEDQRIREWRIRTAIDLQDWAAVRAHITALPEDERNTEEWRYWLALALEKTGERTQAMNRYGELAKERSYHGFLAADLLRWPYAMGHTPITYDTAELQTLRRRPGLVRAHELYRAGLLTDARREWAYAIRDMNREELLQAAVLADQWGWHDRAILTVARSGNYDDLKLRFPLDHLESVQRHAGDKQLDTGLVFAVIRQESAFNSDARSPAGAMGLMQLMPGTGKLTAKRNRIPYSGAGALLEVDMNIRLGTSYLRQMMERFGDNPVLATAAYNAGPHRVGHWLPESVSEPATIWLAGIPFSETRNYVQHVLAYAAIYDWRMRRTINPLKQRMPAVYDIGHYGDTGS